MNIRVSGNFKKMTSKAIFAIILFILVYLCLLALAIGLILVGGYLGISLIIAVPNFFTIIIGLGLASLGFLVLFFLFKFLFKKHKIDRTHLIEITEKQEPKLFRFIEEIVNEVNTDFPKKVYLSADVNAGVFYDSSFLSMFLPIRKNLQIGYGLMNSVTEQEFKAILAHEFGHFSQRSMKVGTYVHNVNQIIFNILYDNESFDKMIQKWISISSYFTIFVVSAVKIIHGIQKILQKLYTNVNLNYLALSREMEFYADEVAANVAGYLPFKESLLRTNLADFAYNSVLNFYDNKIADNLKSKNIFKEQQFVMNFLAKEQDIFFKNNFPLVTELDLSKYNKSKLNIKDQWASHPTTKERFTALEGLKIVDELKMDKPAIVLFDNSNDTEEKITEKLFSNVTYQEEAVALVTEYFQKEYMETYYKNTFPKRYNGYYDNKNPIEFDLENLNDWDNKENFNSLFSKEKVDLIYDYLALENDKNILTSISENKLSIKTFDYDGQKYNTKDAKILIDQLEKEININKTKIEENDKLIYHFFYKQASLKGKENELKNSYLDFFEQDKVYEIRSELYNDIVNSMNFINIQTPFAEIENNFKEISNLETELKTELKGFIENKDLENDLSNPMKENLNKYLSKEWTYFRHNCYVDDNLKLLIAAVNYYNYLISRNYFLKKLHLLNYQMEQLEN